MTASKQEGREHEQKSGECTFGQSYDKCGEYKNCDDCMKMEPSWLSKRDALVAQQERERVVRRFHNAAEAGVRELLDTLAEEEQSLGHLEERR